MTERELFLKNCASKEQLESFLEFEKGVKETAEKNGKTFQEIASLFKFLYDTKGLRDIKILR